VTPELKEPCENKKSALEMLICCAGCLAQEVEHLPKKCKAPISNPITTTKKKKKKLHAILTSLGFFCCYILYNKRSKITGKRNVIVN
jgi:hypothetical protein